MYTKFLILLTYIHCRAAKFTQQYVEKCSLRYSLSSAKEKSDALRKECIFADLCPPLPSFPDFVQEFPEGGGCGCDTTVNVISL